MKLENKKEIDNENTIEKIEDGKLFITKTSVMIERDWNDRNKYMNEEVIFDL